MKSFNVDNFSKLIRNVEMCRFGKLAGYKIYFPFKASQDENYLRFWIKFVITLLYIYWVLGIS